MNNHLEAITIYGRDAIRFAREADAGLLLSVEEDGSMDEPALLSADDAAKRLHDSLTGDSEWTHLTVSVTVRPETVDATVWALAVDVHEGRYSTVGDGKPFNPVL
jgi:hypothetical protein